MAKVRLIAIILLAGVATTIKSSFLYGQPCSPRNTAYLYSTSWIIPENQVTNCVDVTSFRNPNLIDYFNFFQLTNQADTLYADHMNLSRFPAPMVHWLPLLETVDLSGNAIRRIPYRLDRIAPKISKLLMAQNSVFIPKKRPLFHSSSLRMLMLSGNKIKNIYPITFTGMPNLDILYLDDNNLKCVSADMFTSMQHLQYLHLGMNRIKDFPANDMMPSGLRFYITKHQRKSGEYICPA